MLSGYPGLSPQHVTNLHDVALGPPDTPRPHFSLLMEWCGESYDGEKIGNQSRRDSGGREKSVPSKIKQCKESAT